MKIKAKNPRINKNYITVFCNKADNGFTPNGVVSTILTQDIFIAILLTKVYVITILKRLCLKIETFYYLVNFNYVEHIKLYLIGLLKNFVKDKPNLSTFTLHY